MSAPAIEFLLAALFLIGYAFDRARLRPSDPVARHRVRQGLLVLDGLMVLLCTSLGVLSHVAGFDVFEAFWSGELSPFSVIALGAYVCVAVVLAVYVFFWGGDVAMAEMHNCRRLKAFAMTPKGVRLVVGAIYFVFALITAIRLLWF